MTQRFRDGHGLFLAIRAEGAHPYYTTDVLARIFEAEADDLYDVRQAVLGHVQQGGNPSPFDRVLAARLAADAVAAVSAALGAGRSDAVAIGLDNGEIARTPLRRVDDLVDWARRGPNAGCGEPGGYAVRLRQQPGQSRFGLPGDVVAI